MALLPPAADAHLITQLHGPDAPLNRHLTTCLPLACLSEEHRRIEVEINSVSAHVPLLSQGSPADSTLRRTLHRLNPLAPLRRTTAAPRYRQVLFSISASARPGELLAVMGEWAGWASWGGCCRTAGGLGGALLHGCSLLISRSLHCPSVRLLHARPQRQRQDEHADHSGRPPAKGDASGGLGHLQRRAAEQGHPPPHRLCDAGALAGGARALGCPAVLACLASLIPRTPATCHPSAALAPKPHPHPHPPIQDDLLAARGADGGGDAHVCRPAAPAPHHAARRQAGAGGGRAARAGPARLPRHNHRCGLGRVGCRRQLEPLASPPHAYTKLCRLLGAPPA